jgi:hypothetical protein
MHSLGLLKRSYWQSAAAKLKSPVASPATTFFQTLPWQRALLEQLGRAKLGRNRLASGDFENLDSMLTAGWAYFTQPAPGVQPTADLAAEAAHSGEYGLRLAARDSGAPDRSAILEASPIWIASPAVPVEAGSVVAIHGWVQVPVPITGSVDGLLIIDSLTGEQLGERIGDTRGREEFVLYRTVPRSGAMTLNFVLSGFGEAWLDDVTIRTLEPGAVRAAEWDPARTPQRLPPTGLSSFPQIPQMEVRRY